MRIRGNRRHPCRLALAVLGLAAGLSPKADAALATVCSGPLPQPGIVRATLTAYLGTFFPLDEKSCEEITKKAVAACHKAVSDAEKCVADLNSDLRKVSKPVCGTQGSDKGDCNDMFKSVVEDRNAELEGETDDAHGMCDTSFADGFFNDCVNGLPSE
jgi:hypothetical protein